MMTNEDKAFAFANKNADKYINDEDPLCALRDGFLCGAQWKEKQMKSPWHKVADGDLPRMGVRVLVAYGSSYKVCFNERANSTGSGFMGTRTYGDQEPTHWMYVPEIEEG